MLQYPDGCYGFIYLTKNTINGKMYIGMCSSKSRFSDYLGSGSVLKKAILKYGIESFTRSILESCPDRPSLCKAEKKWIDLYVEKFPKRMYNLVVGGKGGSPGKHPWVKMSIPTKKVWDSYTPEEKAARLSNNPNFSHYDKFGANNPKAKSVIIEDENGKRKYPCLKDYAIERGINYSSLKNVAKRFYSKAGYKTKPSSPFAFIKKITLC